jgi:hypothetical protein
LYIILSNSVFLAPHQFLIDRTVRSGRYSQVAETFSSFIQGYYTNVGVLEPGTREVQRGLTLRKTKGGQLHTRVEVSQLTEQVSQRMDAGSRFWSYSPMVSDPILYLPAAARVRIDSSVYPTANRPTSSMDLFIARAQVKR